MNEVLIGILTGIGVFLITFTISAFIRRAGFESRNDRMQEAIENILKENRVQMQVLLPLVMAVRGDRPNGELERAMKLLEEYMINK